MNNGDKPKEIDITLKFGYPGNDSLGNSKMIYDDTINTRFSIVPLLKVFPKKLVLKPKEEQVVRLMLGNLADVPDATYFGRIFVTSADIVEEIDTTFKEDEIIPQFKMAFTVVGALVLRKGNAECKVDITKASFRYDTTNAPFLMVDYDISGNTPFFGTTYIKIKDDKGNVVQELAEVNPIYVDTRKAYKLDKTKVWKGNFQAEVTLTNEHRDVPKEYKTPIDKTTKTLDLKLD